MYWGLGGLEAWTDGGACRRRSAAALETLSLGALGTDAIRMSSHLRRQITAYIEYGTLRQVLSNAEGVNSSMQSAVAHRAASRPSVAAGTPRQTRRRSVTVCKAARDEAPMVDRRSALAGVAAAAAAVAAGLPPAAHAESKLVEKTVPVDALSAFQKVCAAAGPLAAPAMQLLRRF